MKRISAGDGSALLAAAPDAWPRAADEEPAAPYYFSWYFRDAGRRDGEEAMLLLAWKGGTGIWKMKAGLRLLDLYEADAASGLPADGLEKFSLEYLGAVPNSVRAAECLLAALYGEQRDTDLLRRARTALREIPALSGEDASVIRAYEAIAASRVGEKGWTRLFTALFFNNPYGAGQRLAWSFLSGSDGKEDAFSVDDWAAIRGCALVAGRDYGPAMAAFTRLVDAALAGKPSLALSHPLLLQNAGKAFLYGGRPKDGAALFLPLAGSLARRAGAKDKAAARLAFSAYFYAGKMLRAAERYPEAIDAFSRALVLSSDAVNRDATMWYIIDSATGISPEASFPYITRFAAGWSDPHLFSDILERLCIGFVDDGRWESLKVLQSIIEGHASGTIQARCAYVLGRAYELGYIADRSPVSLVLAGSPEGDARESYPRSYPETAERYYRKAFAIETASYYRIMAAWRLDEPLTLTERSDANDDSDTLPGLRGIAGAVEATETGDAAVAPAATPAAGAEAYIDGFFRYGLSRHAFAEAEPYIGILPPGTVRRWSALLAGVKNYSDAMRFMDRLDRRPDYRMSRNDLTLYYPQAYLPEAAAAASRSGLPENLLFGLMRTESYFRADIVSHAGAVGLSQLMPSTAKPVAKHLNIDNPVLTDPGTNLLIGAHYLSDLIDMEDNRPLLAVMGYNGGPGRVRRWLKANPDLPPDLLLETVPIRETREYGRTVLEASVYYGYLYYGKPVAAVVRETLGGEGVPAAR